MQSAAIPKLGVENSRRGVGESPKETDLSEIRAIQRGP